MRIAMFGGSFNPVHIGHLQLAEDVAQEFDLETLFFVPAAKPAHKELDPGATDGQRLDMLRLATRDNPRFGVLDWEIERGGISYTIDTIERMRTDLSQGERPGLVVGADLAANFGAWKQPGRLAELSLIILAVRTGETAPAFEWPHRSIDNHSFRVSSSLVRERIRQGLSARYFLDPEVFAYVRDHGLYR